MIAPTKYLLKVVQNDVIGLYEEVKNAPDHTPTTRDGSTCFVPTAKTSVASGGKMDKMGGMIKTGAVVVVIVVVAEAVAVLVKVNEIVLPPKPGTITPLII